MWYISTPEKRKYQLRNDEEYNLEFFDYGTLYQACPCYNGYVCDDGICKKDIGQICLVSSECTKDAVCHNGVCMAKPDKWETPLNNICKTGLKIIDRTPLILNKTEDEFVSNMGMNDVIALCYFNNLMVVLTIQGLYIDGVMIEEQYRPLNLDRYDGTLLVHNDNLYYLRGDKLYRIEWIEPNKVRWSYYKSKDINTISLSDGSTLVRKHKRYIIDNNSNQTILRNLNIKAMSSNREQISADQIIRSPFDNNVIFYLSNNKVYRYNYVKDQLSIVRGYGKKLIVADNKIWLISDRRCL